MSQGEINIRTNIRERGTWARRQLQNSADFQIRAWGGINLGMAGDFWQFTPVQDTAIFSNPFATYTLATTQDMLKSFWTREQDSIQTFLQLTEEIRCKDPWLSYFLKRARHGNMEHELYCFMHGLPTRHCGSWMPDTGLTACKQSSCADLTSVWTQELRSPDRRTWSERVADECDHCVQERARRCRLWNRHIEPGTKFADAPLIHPWNEPKYDAAIVRAEYYARKLQKILLWCVAEDTPMAAEHRNLATDELAVKKESWATYHDKKTGGIMGFLPLVQNMPMHITQTDVKRKGRIFRNRRVRLWGWTLHPEDEARLQACKCQEMKLLHLPERLFVKVPQETWIEPGMTEPGAVNLEPCNVTWYIDKDHNLPVQRRGFTVASAFSGTAHSFAGESLPAAWIDCLPWTRKADKAAQLSGYMSISRLSFIDDLYITQAYSPQLFAQGDHAGPDLLLKYQTGELEGAALKAAWMKATPRSTKKAEQWPATMPLYCRGCSERCGADICQPLRNFGSYSEEHSWSCLLYTSPSPRDGLLSRIPSSA